MAQQPPFTLLGPEMPRSPVVLAVPHGGRFYPTDVVARARVPLDRLRALEDRHAEKLVDQAVAEGATAIVAHMARAVIDLNRAPREIDPAMIDGPIGDVLLPSAKVRAGLGLFPRRLPSCGELWRGRMGAAFSGTPAAISASFSSAGVWPMRGLGAVIRGVLERFWGE